MIPRKIHYCWFGGGPIPELAQRCMASWHQCMPDYEFKLWNEHNFDVDSVPYTKEAYTEKKYAFVSDYVRLKALKEDGGLYFDVDFLVYKSFDSLLGYRAFAGFEGSKTNPVMMGVIASEPNGEWVSEQLNQYENRHFLVDGKADLTTNVRFITDYMISMGFVPNGREQDYKDLHIFPVEYFCPRLTTGEYIKTDNTYCEHQGLNSWAGQDSSWKFRLLSKISPSLRIFVIKVKRKIFG